MDSLYLYIYYSVAISYMYIKKKSREHVFLMDKNKRINVIREILQKFPNSDKCFQPLSLIALKLFVKYSEILIDRLLFFWYLCHVSYMILE